MNSVNGRPRLAEPAEFEIMTVVYFEAALKFGSDYGTARGTGEDRGEV
jgi:hypothetical protein